MKFQELELEEVREVNGGMVLGSSAAWGSFGQLWDLEQLQELHFTLKDTHNNERIRIKRTSRN